jgi:RNA polymerase sigma factor (sigma-70 family)
MAPAHLGILLRHVHRLSADGGRPVAQSQPSDHQLLEEFTARRSEAAFASLVARHGRMVLRVCRRVLNHEQDAEDAFQATFLVLARRSGSIRKREALAQWLHGVAYRTSMEAKRKAARRRNHETHLRTEAPRPTSSPTWDDVQTVLDEEIERLPEAFRSAFVLCVLQGKSGPEAAAELGIKEGTVATRLLRARRRLQQQLARRGIKLGALLAALAVAESGSQAAVPLRLTSAALRCGLWVAAGGLGHPAAGPIPRAVAALAAGVTRAMFFTKARIATALLLAAGALAGASFWAQQALPAKEADTPPVPAAPGQVERAPARPPVRAAEHKSAETFTYKGRVLDADGRPVAGAKLYLVPLPGSAKGPSVRATTEADGRFEFTAARKEFVPGEIRTDFDLFSYLQVVAVAQGHAPDWTATGQRPPAELTLRLPRSSETIQGRILDLQGKAIAGAKVNVVRLETTPEDDLTPFLKGLRNPGGTHLALSRLSKTLTDPSPAGLPRTVTTNADGCFRLPGAGKEHVVVLSIEAPEIEHATIRVLPRTAAEVKDLVRPPSESMMQRGEMAPPTMYGTRFDHLGLPARLIAGTVRDKETGKAMAGVRVDGHAVGGLGGIRSHDETRAEAVTDKDGRYQLRGLPKSGKYHLTFWPGDFSVYIPGGKEVSGGEGLTTAKADFDMIRGIEIRGRVTDKVTGKPVAAGVTYTPLPSNHHPGAAYFRMCSKNCEGPILGTFREMVPPGAGVLRVRVRTLGDENPYTTVRLDPADQTKFGLSEFTIMGANAYRIIDVPADAKSLTYDLQVDPGRSVSGTVLGPDGKPLTEAMVKGLTAVWPTPRPLKTARFTAVALTAGEKRELLFVHLKRKLAGKLVVHGDEKGDVSVKLEPWGTLTGRILDEDGRPMAGVRIQMGFLDPMFYQPVTWWVPPQGEEIKTDRDGRFRAEGITPGMEFRLSASSEKRFFLPLAGTPDGMRILSVRSGETKDLGDLTAKPE